MVAVGWYQNSVVKTALDRANTIQTSVGIVNEMRTANLDLVLAAMDTIIDWMHHQGSKSGAAATSATTTAGTATTGGGTTTNKPATNAPKPSQIVRPSELAIRPYLESDAEVDAYIETLREAFADILKSGKRIRIQ